MAEPSISPRATAPADHLRRQIEETWREHDRFVAEGGDPDEELDQVAEELFGSAEATQALLDFIERTTSGVGFAWDDEPIDNEQ